MLDNLILNKKSIESIYRTICEFHEKYLKQCSVKLPKLYSPQGNFTKDALVLVYLAYDYPNTRRVSKEELTKFVRSHYPNTNDVQQAKKNIIFVAPLVAHRRTNHIFIGQQQKRFCKKHT